MSRKEHKRKKTLSRGLVGIRNHPPVLSEQSRRWGTLLIRALCLCFYVRMEDLSDVERKRKHTNTKSMLVLPCAAFTSYRMVERMGKLDNLRQSYDWRIGCVRVKTMFPSRSCMLTWSLFTSRKHVTMKTLVWKECITTILRSPCTKACVKK